MVHLYQVEVKICHNMFHDAGFVVVYIGESGGNGINTWYVVRYS